jgi:hypothetical protein
MEFILNKPQIQLLLAAMDSDRKSGHRGRPDCLKHILVDGNRAITTDTQMVAVVRLGEANDVDMPPMLIDGSTIRDLAKGVNRLAVSYDGEAYVRVKRQPNQKEAPASAKVMIGNPASYPVWSIDDYLKKTQTIGTAPAAELKQALSKKAFANDAIKANPGHLHILFSDSKAELRWRDKASGREIHVLTLMRTSKKNADIFLNPYQLKSVLRPAGLWDGSIAIGIQNRMAARFDVPGVQVLLSGFPYLDGRSVLILTDPQS